MRGCIYSFNGYPTCLDRGQYLILRIYFVDYFRAKVLYGYLATLDGLGNGHYTKKTMAYV